MYVTNFYTNVKQQAKFCNNISNQQDATSSVLLILSSLVASSVGVSYQKLQIQSSAPEDGRNYRPKHVELI
jgi:hypothetical protein